MPWNILLEPVNKFIVETLIFNTLSKWKKTTQLIISEKQVHFKLWEKTDYEWENDEEVLVNIYYTFLSFSSYDVYLNDWRMFRTLFAPTDRFFNSSQGTQTMLQEE